MHCNEWKHIKNKTQHLISPSIWIQVIVVQLLSRAQYFATPWTAAQQCFQSFNIAWSLLKLRSIKSVMPSNYLVLLCTLLHLIPSFPASGCFPMNHLFTSGGQSIGASASSSALPRKIQGQFPLGLTGLISLLSKGLSTIFSRATVQKCKFFSAQSSLWSNCHTGTWLRGRP